MSPIRQAKSKQTESPQDKKGKKGNKVSRATQRAPGGVKESFGVWDVAEHLSTEEEMVAYLEACMEESDPELICAALGDIARARNMSQLARDRE